MAFLAGLIPSVIGLAKGGAKGAAKKKGGFFGTQVKRRRRRARITPSEMAELSQIKAILGKTAAANALPFYMGRGR